MDMPTSKFKTGILVALLMIAAGWTAAGAAPVSPVRSFPLPSPMVEGLAYADGALWTLSPMGPGMTTLIRMDPGNGLPNFTMFGSARADALAHDGTNFFATRDAGAWTCGSANPNHIEILDPATGAVVGVLPSPAASQAGGLAFLGGDLYAAGVVDADPCDAVPGVSSITALNPADGSVLSSFETGTLGAEPQHLTSNGTHLLFGTWSGVEGVAPSSFNWTVFSLDPAGNVVDSQVLFETLALTGSQASQSYDIGGLAWANGELYVLNLSTLTVQVFAFPVAETPPPPPPPAAAEVELDIRPGDDENCINLLSKGKVPAAVLSSGDFDASSLDPATVTLASAAVVSKNMNGWMADVGDVNFDGLPDLVVHFYTQELELTNDDTEAVLHGWTFDGKEIECSDQVKVIHGDKFADQVHGWEKDHPGERVGQRNRLDPLASVSRPASLSLALAGPNPSRGDVVLSFTLTGSERATLEVVNVTGRRLMSEDVGYLGAGVHAFDIGSRQRLPAGMYFVRLRQGSQFAQAKVSVLP
jgi:hypothetical protein